MSAEALSESLRLQGRICLSMGSPFSGSLLSHAAETLAADEGVRALFAPWAEASRETLFGDAVPLRWLGAAHDLALSGEDETLSAAWPAPDRPGDEPAAWAAVRGAMRERAARFAEFMRHEPQTNEVRRSACLLPGFVAVARRTGLPLRTFELGASAGLNQLWDRYRYDLGSAGAWGDPASPVRLDTEWRGPPTDLSGDVLVASRSACDRKPIDLRDPLARRRLRAYIWADQFERLSRLNAAIALALEADVRVEAADALDFVRAAVAPTPGAASVVYHSVFWQYLPSATQSGLAEAIGAAGHRATSAAPLAWLRMEALPQSLAEMELRLTLWPGGDERRLARCHPHGAWIEWEAT
jgi:hypothetical protein